MAENDRPAYCGRCGTALDLGDRFCGNCGTAVMTPPQQAEQMIPREEAAEQGPAPRGFAVLRSRRLTVLRLAGLGVAAALLTGVGILLAVGLLGGGSGTTNTAEPPPVTVTEEEPPIRETTLYSTTLPTDPTPPTTTETTSESSGFITEEEFNERFFDIYYDAVDRGDWSDTHELLDGESRSEFTEDEWVDVQRARVEAEGEPPPLDEVSVINTYGGSSRFVARLSLAYEDGTEETIDVNISVENGRYARHFAEEDVSYLRGL